MRRKTQNFALDEKRPYKGREASLLDSLDEFASKSAEPSKNSYCLVRLIRALTFAIKYSAWNWNLMQISIVLQADQFCTVAVHTLHCSTPQPSNNLRLHRFVQVNQHSRFSWNWLRSLGLVAFTRWEFIESFCIMHRLGGYWLRSRCAQHQTMNLLIVINWMFRKQTHCLLNFAHLVLVINENVETRKNYLFQLKSLRKWWNISRRLF